GSVLYAVPANAGTPGSPAGLVVAAAEDDAPAAAVFGQVPAAQVRNDYEQSLYTPPTGGESTTYTIYQVHVDTSVTPTVTWYQQLLSTSDPTEPFSLNDGLELDLATGHITAAAADLRQTDSEPEQYLMVINNGVGGAETASDGTLYNETDGMYTEIPVALHDVSSGPFSIPVLFNDVPTDNTLSTAIYGLRS